MPDDHIKSEILAYLSGALTEVRSRQIDAHAAACEKCRQALAKARSKQARVKREALKKASPDPMPNLFLARQGKNAGVDRPSSKGPWVIVAGLVLAGGVYGIHRHFSAGFRAAQTPGAPSDSSPGEASSAPVVSPAPASAGATAGKPAAPAVPEVPVAPAPNPLVLEVKQEWKGVDSGIKDSRVVVIRNEDVWDKLWTEMQQNEPRPPVRFSRHVVVGVFGGPRTAAATIRLGRILERADDVVIPYSFSGPPVVVSTMTVPAPGTLSYPYLLSVIPRVEKKIRLTQKEENP